MSWLLASWAALAAVFSLIAVSRLKKQKRQEHQPACDDWPEVLLLRPVDAPSALELDNLNAVVDYPGTLRQVVLSPFRPRLDVARTGWLASDPNSSNRKVGHLTYALAALLRPGAGEPVGEVCRPGVAGDEKPTTPGAGAAPGAPGAPVVVSIDADVRVTGALVKSLVAGIRAGAALVSAAPLPEVHGSLGGRASRGLLVQSHQAFRALDVMSAGARAVCGKALAFSPRALEVLPQLSECIGEDLELSRRLHALGLPVAMAFEPAVVPQPKSPRLRDVHERFTRWMQVLRAHRPELFPSVPLLFCPTPLLLPLALVSSSAVFFLATLGLVGARTFLAATMDPRRGLRFEWLLGEAVLLGAFVHSLLKRGQVEWRGRTFVLAPGGTMSPLRDGAGP